MWYNHKRGYGFVRCNDLKEMLHVNWRQIQSANASEGGPLLTKDQKVEFEVADGRPLREAVAVVIKQETTHTEKCENAQRTPTIKLIKKTTEIPDEELSLLGQLFDESSSKEMGNASPLPQRGYRQRFENDP